MNILLNDNILTINEHQIDIFDVNSIVRFKNIVKINTKSAKLELCLQSTKEAREVISNLETILSAHKNFIRCDGATILNVNNLQSLTVKPINNEDYGAKFNF